MQVATLSIVALRQLDYVLAYGNKNTLSDLAVAALMIYAGLEGALLNVKINIPGISDQEVVEKYTTKTNEYLEEALEIKDSILFKVHNRL